MYKLLCIFFIVIFPLGEGADKTEIKKITEFYQCLACGEGIEGIDMRSKYYRCREILPAKFFSLERSCNKKVLSDYKVNSDVWQQICVDINVARKIYDCVVEEEKKMKLSKDDNFRLNEFKRCCRKVDDEFCGALGTESPNK